ncbi:MAG: 3-oxoacyl-[acyl-carrier-protein] reductase [Nitrospinota bacterium]
MKRLKNKVAIITGAARGIGQAIAIEFAKEGANLAIGATKESSLENSLNMLKEYDIEVLPFWGDVALLEHAKEVSAKVAAHFGKIDILVNNAGITKDSLLIRMKESDFDDVIKINLNGTFNFTQSVAKVMLKERAGSIVNISSVAGEIGNAGQVNYSAAKAGIIGLTKTLAKELGGRNIRVNSVTPGFIETDMTSNLNEKVKSSILANIPLSRFGLASEVSKAVTFLASDDSTYITGAVLPVNGGLAM